LKQKGEQNSMMQKAVSHRWVYEADDPSGGYFGDLPEFKMLGYDRFTEALPLSVHQHERCFEFVYLESGKASWEVGPDSYTTHAGQVFHTRPGEWHKARQNYIEPSTIWWLIIEDPAHLDHWLDLRERDLQQLTGALYELPRVVTADPRIREAFREMRKAIDQRGPLASLKLRHAILDVLLRILFPPNSQLLPMNVQEDLLRLTEKIKEAPDLPWSTKRLSAELGVSESHVYRVFKGMYGQSPATYITRLRIELACERLKEGAAATMTDLSLDLGFKTSQHFAAVFKKYTGMTPSQWRIRNRQ
jgi:AraC-like DNA-binding protein/mannose-6-phosphate isomerase-like protein (cupin superfamily)